MKILTFCLLAILLFANESKLQVFQPPTSTCPKSWFADMEKIAKKVDVITVRNVKNLKRQIGIPYDIQSCNTSIMGDYVFEGNVPFKAIKDFLKEKPKDAIGLSLPAYENDKNPKTVYILFDDKSYKEYGKY